MAFGAPLWNFNGGLGSLGASGMANARGNYNKFQNAWGNNQLGLSAADFSNMRGASALGNPWNVPGSAADFSDLRAGFQTGRYGASDFSDFRNRLLSNQGVMGPQPTMGAGPPAAAPGTPLLGALQGFRQGPNPMAAAGTTRPWVPGPEAKTLPPVNMLGPAADYQNRRTNLGNFRNAFGNNQVGAADFANMRRDSITGVPWTFGEATRGAVAPVSRAAVAPLSRQPAAASPPYWNAPINQVSARNQRLYGNNPPPGPIQPNPYIGPGMTF